MAYKAAFPNNSTEGIQYSYVESNKRDETINQILEIIELMEGKYVAKGEFPDQRFLGDSYNYIASVANKIGVNILRSSKVDGPRNAKSGSLIFELYVDFKNLVKALNNYYQIEKIVIKNPNGNNLDNESPEFYERIICGMIDEVDWIRFNTGNVNEDPQCPDFSIACEKLSIDFDFIKYHKTRRIDPPAERFRNRDLRGAR